jgi:hypothetical protein
MIQSNPLQSCSEDAPVTFWENLFPSDVVDLYQLYRIDLLWKQPR